jgi:predicted nucleotidyltransferase
MTVAVEYVSGRLEQVARDLGLRMVVLFGSRATGRALRPTSDLDIAVLDRVVPTWTRWAEVHRALSQVFRPYELDLAFLNTADAFFRLEIMRRAVLLYGDRDTFDAYRVFAYRDFVETEDLRKLEDVLMRKKMAFLRRCLHGE